MSVDWASMLYTLSGAELLMIVHRFTGIFDRTRRNLMDVYVLFRKALNLASIPSLT